jgi:hypothetical protein
MGIRNFPVITIGTDTSLTVANISASGSVAIPTTHGGVGPKYLYIHSYGGTDNTAYISFTPDVAANTGTFATGFVMWAFEKGETIILNVHGYSHIGYDFLGTNPDFQLTPLEDY